jgi:hypothetical protein
VTTSDARWRGRWSRGAQRLLSGEDLAATPHSDSAIPVVVAVGAFACAAALLTGAFGVTTRSHEFFAFSDIGLYHQYAIAMDAGLRPFVSFPAEYPSAALRLFALPGHPADLPRFNIWFAGLMLAAMAAAAVLVSLAAQRLWRLGSALAGLIFAASVLAIGTIVATRYDAAVALCIALFLWAVSGRRWIIAGIAVGLGTALKLTPIVLLPLPLLLATTWRDRAKVAGPFAITAIVPFLADGAAAWTGVLTVFRYHGSRPLQIESVLATPLLLARISGAAGVSYGTANGAQTIIGPGAGALATLSGFFAAAALAAVLAFAVRARRRGMADERWIVLAATALLLAVVVPSKVLSPQYLVWLLPVVALVGRASRALTILLFAAVLLTGLEFPAMYWDFLRFETGPVLVVAARNLALTIALGWAVTLLAREGSDAAGPGIAAP